ncbi:hypothetical protein [Bacillus sp. JJ1562]|uniref:hypothetical protein n=1 Tax=Bacillus sp. JJ1562 TaxID=3122960 RepID=UPI0030028955
MLKIYRYAKYKWHRLHFSMNKAILSGCKDERLIKKLEQKMNYHEQTALMLLVKRE